MPTLHEPARELEHFSYYCRAENGSLNQALASSAVSSGSSSAMAWSRASLVRAEQLFELGPSLLYGVQIGRVRWQVEQLGSCRFDSFAYSVDVVRTEIVHHHRSEEHTSELQSPCN